MLKFFELPYQLDSLADAISSEAMDIHYNKHHRSYFDKLEKIISGTSFEGEAIESIIIKSCSKPNSRSIFNNAAQVFNHDFFWKSLDPEKKEASSFVVNMIKDKFSSWDNFQDIFKEAGLNHFASGWLWLVLDGEEIKITTTANAENPLVKNQVPLLCVDLWEHAYYVDYKNRRGDYLDSIIRSFLNWSFFEENLKKAKL
jgi:superoxide dismutase, Fe-Mn family